MVQTARCGPAGPVAGAEDVRLPARAAMDIVIIGAGIGGLAVASALAGKGALVRVFEQGDGIRQPGAGITVGGNAARVLNQFGHGGLRGRSGVASTAARLHYWKDGQVLAVGMAGGQE